MQQAQMIDTPYKGEVVPCPSGPCSHILGFSPPKETLFLFQKKIQDLTEEESRGRCVSHLFKL